MFDKDQTTTTITINRRRKNYQMCLKEIKAKWLLFVPLQHTIFMWPVSQQTNKKKHIHTIHVWDAEASGWTGRILYSYSKFYFIFCTTKVLQFFLCFFWFGCVLCVLVSFGGYRYSSKGHSSPFFTWALLYYVFICM